MGSGSGARARVARRASKAASPPGVTLNLFIARKASPSSVVLPSASTCRQPPGVASGAVPPDTGSRPSHMAALGLPLVFRAVATSIDAIPPRVPPPCASLKASPAFHASKLGLSSHTVHEM